MKRENCKALKGPLKLPPEFVNVLVAERRGKAGKLAAAYVVKRTT